MDMGLKAFGKVIDKGKFPRMCHIVKPTKLLHTSLQLPSKIVARHVCISIPQSQLVTLETIIKQKLTSTEPGGISVGSAVVVSNLNM